MTHVYHWLRLSMRCWLACSRLIAEKKCGGWVALSTVHQSDRPRLSQLSSAQFEIYNQATTKSQGSRRTTRTVSRQQASVMLSPMQVGDAVLGQACEAAVYVVDHTMPRVSKYWLHWDAEDNDLGPIIPEFGHVVPPQQPKKTKTNQAPTATMA